jgi:hypothetical protein
MTNLKQEGTKTMAARIRPFKGWTILFGLVLVVAVAGSAAACNAAPASSADNTFTKWVTTSPPATGVVANMVGVVGGDVGSGTYSGEILVMKSDPVAKTTTIEALYHFTGSKHAFTAHVNIAQDDAAGTAVITGSVTDGWLKGASVAGKYNVLAVCPMPTPANAYGTACYQGALHVGP